jgi:hypothetical protein
MEMKVRQKSKQAKKVVPIKNLSPDEVVQENILRMMQELSVAYKDDISEPQMIFDQMYWLSYMLLKRAEKSTEKQALIMGLFNDAIGSAMREMFLEKHGEEE